MAVRARVLCSGAAALVIMSVVLSACGSGGKSAASTVKAAKTVTTTTTSDSLAQLVAKTDGGVIRIQAYGCGEEDIGTGFLISPDLVATVDHVIANASRISLIRDGKTLGTGSVIGEDPARDVALVQSSKPLSGYTFQFLSSAPVLGESVAAMGFPLGMPLSVNPGIVSGTDRTVPIDGIKRRDLVQTDASLNPGNSGGPLIDLDSGRVVGLVDLKNVEASGISYAVSAQVAAPLLDAWKAAPQAGAPVSCTTTTTTTSAATTTAPAPTVATYPGAAFSIEYPVGWTIVSAEQQHSYGTDTTIQDPAEPTALIRVDVSQHVFTTNLRSLAQGEINALSQQPGYQLIKLGPSTVDGFNALDWEFTVDQGGVLLQKEDVFFVDTDTNEGVAVLTQAPASEYASDAAAFALLRQTLIMN